MTWMEAKYAGTCAGCECPLYVGEVIYYDGPGTAYCQPCGREVEREKHKETP